MRVTFVVDRFNGAEDPDGILLDHLALWSWLRALVDIHKQYLSRHPEIPSLYELHDRGLLRYQEEPPGEEDWLDPPSMLKQGWGDCEEVAAWRAAELQLRHGLAAEPYFMWRREADGDKYHILVKYPDGLIEDPCRRLGMR